MICFVTKFSTFPKESDAKAVNLNDNSHKHADRGLLNLDALAMHEIL